MVHREETLPGRQHHVATSTTILLEETWQGYVSHNDDYVDDVDRSTTKQEKSTTILWRGSTFCVTDVENETPWELKAV